MLAPTQNSLLEVVKSKIQLISTNLTATFHSLSFGNDRERAQPSKQSRPFQVLR